MEDSVSKYLKRKYHDAKQTGAFSGVDKFYRAIRRDGQYKVSRAQIKQFLQSDQNYTLQRQVQRKFTRRSMIIPYVGYQIEIDCCYMTQFTESNDGYGYFILAIDCFSKFASTHALKTLKSAEVAKALSNVLDSFKVIENVRTDMGSEFKGKQVQKIFKNRNIKSFFSLNEKKCAIVERCIKTIKSLLTRYMKQKNTNRWVDKLQEVTANYNNSYHSAIKRAPSSVTEADEYQIWKITQDRPRSNPQTIVPFKFELNDTVRISALKSTFHRAYDDNWTREVFLVSERSMKQGLPVYRLKDQHNQPIEGSFYQSELLKVTVRDDEVYLIERIIKRRGGRSLVRWKGYSARHDTWLLNSEIINFKSD